MPSPSEVTPDPQFCGSCAPPEGRSCANLGGVTVLEAQNLNSLQTVSARNLLLTQDAIKVIDGLWGEGKAGG